MRCVKQSCLYVHSSGQTISECSSSPYYRRSKVGGMWVVQGCVSALSMGPLCQRSRRDGRNPPPGAFKRFPLHLNRVWQRRCSENTTELRPLGKRVEEHIWVCSQRLALAPEVRSPWLALSAVSGERLCHCLVQSGNTALNLAIHSRELSLLWLKLLVLSPGF